MDPGTGALLGGLAGGAASLIGSRRANADRRSLYEHQFRNDVAFAREQREWNLTQADSAMQRRVTDLEKAGLNPVIAFGGAAGGESSQSVNSNPVQIEDELSRGVSGAIEGAMMSNQVRRLKSEIGNIEASTGKAIQETATGEAQEKLLKAQAASVKQNIDIKGPTEKLMEGIDSIIKKLKDNPTRNPWDYPSKKQKDILGPLNRR